MSATIDPTGIVNLSLDVIKTENINNVEIPAGDKSAIIAQRWYDDVRRKALEGFPWNFASTRDAIPLSATGPPFGFDDAYTLPTNYISLNFIKYWDYPLSQFNYMVEDGKIYMDNDGATSLNIGYVYNLIEVVKFSPAFKIYLAYCLAEKIVFKLTGNVNLQNRIINGKKSEEINARAVNGKANPPVAFRRSKMLNARRRFSSSLSTFLSTGQDGRT